MIKPEKNRLSWDDHHMLLAIVTSYRSPDPNTKVGAVVVDNLNRVIGLGYNGLPRDISPYLIPWERSNENPLLTKYPFIVHAEKNAISNCSKRSNAISIYCTLFPCNECMKDIIQAGIKKIVYLEDKYKDTWQVKAAKQMSDIVGIELKKYKLSDNVKNTISSILSSIVETT